MGHKERLSHKHLDQLEASEDLNPRHFYAAYIYDRAEEHKEDVATLVEKAHELDYPVRFWWLSDAVDLQGFPDRLIVCVHHPSMTEDAGMDLYEALKEKEVSWNELEAAGVNEYAFLGQPVDKLDSISKPNGSPLYASEVEDVEQASPRAKDLAEPVVLLPLELADVRLTAVEQLGRELNEAEMEMVAAHLTKTMDEPTEWALRVRQSIGDCVELGLIQVDK
jgi:hypothetical protein